MTFAIALLGAVLGAMAFLDQRRTHVTIIRAELRAVAPTFLFDPLAELPESGPVPASVTVTTSMSNDSLKGIGVISAELLLRGRVVSRATSYVRDPGEISRTRAEANRAIQSAAPLPFSLGERQSDSIALVFRIPDLTKLGLSLTSDGGNFRGDLSPQIFGRRARLRLQLQDGASSTSGVAVARQFYDEAPWGSVTRCDGRRLASIALLGTRVGATIAKLRIWREGSPTAAVRTVTAPVLPVGRGGYRGSFALGGLPRGRYVWAVEVHDRVVAAGRLQAPHDGACRGSF